jgi:NAD(P)-dependent dehydrogenase (short-subunit alcohol dehydrogenase family)
LTILDGQVSLITGASRGIGRATARAFAAEGSSIIAVARTKADLQSLAGEIEAMGGAVLTICADLSQEEEITRSMDAALARFGRVDVLMNNAGFVPPSVDLIDLSAELWRRVIDLNLTAVALMTKAVLPSMRARGKGKIINIASAGGRGGARGRSVYRASKAAVINLTESVAAEVKEYGIDVNCICPAAVDTEGFRSAFHSTGRQENPSLMAPEEIAALALFLASPQSSAITGTAIDALGSSNPLFR